VVHHVTPTDGPIANRGWLDTVSIKHIANGGLAGLETQLEEFAMDLAISPARVLARQAQDQIVEFLIDARSAPLVFLFVGPFQAHQLAKNDDFQVFILFG
jgi:hypothetical protein